MQAERPSLTSSPSLSAYVHDHLSVVRSFSHCSDEPTTRSESDSDHKHQQQQGKREGEQEAAENENESNNSGGGFEFSFNCAEAMSSPISADQIFHNGRIKLTVPIYEVARVYPEQEDRKSTGAVDDPRLKVAVEKMIQKTSRRKALRRLFMEEKEKYSSAPSNSISTSASASTSSSETDEATENASNSELESVPSNTYCVWKPKTPSDSNPTEISKNSEPLSKRWKLKDLLTRNTSEKDSKSHTQTQSSSNNSNKNEKEVRAAPQPARKMAMKEGGERLKSYLPYRQELVWIFGSSGSGRNLQRF